MIIKCEQKDEKRILDYIGEDYSSCLYLYLNLLKYGIDSDTIEVFIQCEESVITALLLKYYSCLHVYSKDNSFCADELVAFFSDNSFTILYCTAKTADVVYAAFSEEFLGKATMEKGWVAQIKKIDKEPQRLAEKAKTKDFDQIARLIFDDEDIGASYRFEELSKQLEERNQQGYARNLIIKQDGIVIAHACTNAELNNIAVVAELLVRKENRRSGYASEIWRDLCGQLLDEGKEVYSFYYSKESEDLHSHIGFFKVCEWAKIVIV